MEVEGDEDEDEDEYVRSWGQLELGLVVSTVLHCTDLFCMYVYISATQMR